VNDSAFGFRVRSEPTLRFVRSGGGVEPLEVVTAHEPRTRPELPALARWTLAGADRDVGAALYRVEGGFEYWVAEAGAYRVDPERGRIEIPDCEGEDEIVREQRLWGIPATLCYMARDDLSLHAAAVEVGGRAVLLAGPGRHGKSTLALAFHERGHRVLSEDLACCRVSPSPAVLPGPALLRIRPDVYEGRAPEGTRAVLTRPDRIYLMLDQDRRGDGAPVPLAAIVFLRRSADEVRMERTSPAEALPDLWALNFRLPTDEGRARSFRQLSRLAAELPIWNLHRPFRPESLDATVDRVVRAVGSP